MKIKEILVEAQINPKIREVLQSKGYKFLGSGQDQTVYLAPDGTVLKIFDYLRDSNYLIYGFSKAQQSFINFANFCMSQPNNPFLPKFGGWATFTFEGQKYLQIKSERLFHFTYGDIISEELEVLGEVIEQYGANLGFKHLMKRYDENNKVDSAIGEMITLLGGEKNTKLFCKTIEQLVKIANSKDYAMDLHGGNFMLSSEGEIIINDPFQ